VKIKILIRYYYPIRKPFRNKRKQLFIDSSDYFRRPYEIRPQIYGKWNNANISRGQNANGKDTRVHEEGIWRQEKDDKSHSIESDANYDVDNAILSGYCDWTVNDLKQKVVINEESFRLFKDA